MASLKIQRSIFPELVLLGSLAGFPFVAAIADFFSLPSTLLSIALRATIFILCVIALIHVKKPKRQQTGETLIRLAMLFWIIYLIRLSYYTTAFPSNLRLTPALYWVWALGVCLIPMLSISSASGKQIDFDRSFRMLFVVGFIAILMAYFSASTEVYRDGRLLDIGRIQLDSLNPISLGRLGAVMTALSIWLILKKRYFEFPNLARGAAVVAVAIGVYLMINSGSRGPVLALLSSLMLLTFASSIRRGVAMALIFMLLASAIYISAERFSILNMDALLGRFAAMQQMSDMAAQERLTSFGGAVAAFRDSPILGFGLEEPRTGFYPHNLVLEAFMSTGLIGGVIFLWICASGVLVSIRLFKSNNPDGWVGLLFIIYLVQGMFSGALYQSGEFWCSVAILTVAAARAKAQSTDHPVTPQHAAAPVLADER